MDTGRGSAGALVFLRPFPGSTRADRSGRCRAVCAEGGPWNQTPRPAWVVGGAWPLSYQTRASDGDRWGPSSWAFGGIRHAGLLQEIKSSGESLHCHRVRLGTERRRTKDAPCLSPGNSGPKAEARHQIQLRKRRDQPGRPGAVPAAAPDPGAARAREGMGAQGSTPVSSEAPQPLGQRGRWASSWGKGRGEAL